MAIQNRRGLMADFDPNKLLPGEFAFPLDTGEVYYCVAPGNVKRVATKEELQEILTSSPEAYTALKQLLSDLELNPSELTNILNNIASLQSDKLDKTGDSKDNTATFTEAEEDENIESGEPHYTLFGKILKSIKTLRNSLTGKFDKANVVQSAEIDDEDKVHSAAVTNGLANQITQLNNNLANVFVQDKSLDQILTNPLSSTDIRLLMYQIPSGTYIVGAYTLNNVIFPIPIGDGLIVTWFRTNYSVNGFYYGILIVREMIGVDNKTYICSIYNNTEYTNWSVNG